MSADYLNDGENENDIEDTETQFNYNHEGIIFLIDSRSTMFAKQYFKLCMMCVKTVMLQMIKSGSKRPIGVILFGTDNKDNTTHKKSATLLHPLSVAKEDSIMRVEEISSYTYDIFSKNFGCADEANLAEALETCFYFFSNCPIKMSYKRILLFTNDENPDANCQDKQHQARKRAEDFSQGEIDLDVIPLGDSFDKTVFYQDLVETVKKQNYVIDGPFSDVYDMLPSIYKESSKQRSLGKVKFDLGCGIYIHVSFYKFTAKSKNVKITKLDRETNERVTHVQQMLHPETCAPLTSNEVVKCINIKEKNVTFSNEEWCEIKQAFKPGMTLLGFKPCNRFKVEYQCNTSSFIFPDESSTKGSSALFTALWRRCLARNIMAVCVLTTRQGSKPRYVLLIPQECVTEGEPFNRLPGGFHIFYLPFSETIGTMPVSETKTTVSINQLEIAKKVIKKLRIKYDPTMMDNPKTTKEWAYIEASALSYPDMVPFSDSTLPDNDRIESMLGPLVEEFKNAFNITDNKSIRKPSKRQTDEENPFQNKKVKQHQPIEQLISAKKVDILTVAQLKEHLMSVGCKSLSGRKKPDLVNLVYINAKK